MLPAEQPTEPNQRRETCAVHGLAIRDDGRCVLCARQGASRGGTSRLWWGLGLGVLVLALGLGGYAFLRAAGPSADRGAAKEAAPPPAQDEDAFVPVEPARKPVARVSARGPRQPEILAEVGVDSGAAETATDRGDEARDRQEQKREEEAAVRREMRRIPITIYVTSWCPHCTRARAWLDANGYTYEEYDVEADDRARRVRDRLNPGRSVPTIDVDGMTLVGFSERSVERALRERARRRLEP